MALNPAYTSTTSRKLPLAFGYVLGIGDEVLNTVVATQPLTSSATPAASDAYYIFLLGDAEWDGPEMFCLGGDTNLATLTGLTGIVASAAFSKVAHFHSGQWGIKGAGNAATSTGIGAGVDAYMPNFPSPTPRQALSGIAYIGYNFSTSYLVFNVLYKRTTISTGKPVGIWRSTRCRTFDANGNVISYGFTCNPAWHFVEAILRYKIKPQQPPIAGLTAAEKACFNWSSIVATAARNDFILPNGNPRFVGNYIFAADTTLTNILETILRVSRSYTYVDGGQIFLVGDDARAPVFTLSAKHLVRETVKLAKKDISRSPNQFIPKYRDLDMTAVTAVTQLVGVALGSSSLGFALSTSDSPFVLGDLVTYGGGTAVPVPSGSGSGTPTAYAGTYNVTESTNPITHVSSYLPQATGLQIGGGVFPPGVPGVPEPVIATGGYLGTNNSRFSDRSPTGVQHLSHQKLVVAQAPGLTVQPRKIPVTYDMGNSTFDQTNRVMKFERDSQLGPDTGASWTAPITGTLTAYLEAVDGNGKYLKDAKCHNVIVVDDWVSPEFPGQYWIKTKTVKAPVGNQQATVEFELMTYYPSAYTDVSDNPGDAYNTVPGTGLQLTGFTPAHNPAWTLQATPHGVVNGSTATIAIPDLVMQIGGVAGTTSVVGFAVPNVPLNTTVVLFVVNPTVNPSFGFSIGTILADTSSPSIYIVLVGSFTTTVPTGTTPGDPSILFQPA